MVQSGIRLRTRAPPSPSAPNTNDGSRREEIDAGVSFGLFSDVVVALAQYGHSHINTRRKHPHRHTRQRNERTATTAEKRFNDRHIAKSLQANSAKALTARYTESQPRTYS
jgi:hypothetical protein